MGALSEVTLLLGAPDFLGGMPVLKYLPVKISEFLQKVHQDKLPAFGLPARGSRQVLELLQVDQLFERIEAVGKDLTRIILLGGVLIGHKEYEGCQRVYAWPFPHKKFLDFNRQHPVFLLPERAVRATLHPDSDNV